MADNLDIFTQQLQAEIYEETRADWGDDAFQRWVSPPNIGVIDDADGKAALRGICGDQIAIYLKFEKNRVIRAVFTTDGCGPSIVCGSFAAEMAEGRTPEELIDITGEEILARAGRIPEDHEHCAFLAASVLKEAVNDYMIRKTSGTVQAVDIMDKQDDSQ